MDVVGAAQFRNKVVISSSSLLSSLTYKDNPYAVIKNQYGLVVGQLLSDGMNIAMSSNLFGKRNIDDNFIGLENNFAEARITPSENDHRRQASEVNNFTLCIDGRVDIKNSDNDFPILDFATTYDFKNWIPLRANISFDGSRYCASITTNSTLIFPISLTKDWETRSSIFTNKNIRNAMYFLSAAMMALFVGCLVVIILQFIEKQSLNLTKITLICLLCKKNFLFF